MKLNSKNVKVAKKMLKSFGAIRYYYSKEIEQFFFIIRTGRVDKKGIELFHVLTEEGKFLLSNVPVYWDYEMEIPPHIDWKVQKVYGNI